MPNVNLYENYPVTLQIQPASPRIFDFSNDEGTITVDPELTTVEATNSRGGVVIAQTSDGVFIDQSKLIVGYNWDTTKFSPQEYYTFTFRVGIIYVTEWDESVTPRVPKTTQTFKLESSITKALQSVNVFSS